MVVKQFRIPESLSKWLTLEAIRRKEDMSKVLIFSLEAERDRGSAETIKLTPDVIRAALREELQSSSGLNLDIPANNRAGLEDLAKELNFNSVADFLAGLANAAIGHRDLVEQLISGKGNLPGLNKAYPSSATAAEVFDKVATQQERKDGVARKDSKQKQHQKSA